MLIGTFPPGGTEFWEGGDDEGDDDTNKNPANPTNPTYQRIVVEVDGPFHYSREPSRDTLGGDGLEDWFSGGNGGGGVNGDDDDCESPASAPKGVGRDGDGDHENGNGRWPLGSTVLRNQLLAAWGMRVVTVTYHEWERLGTRSAKETHVAGLLETRARWMLGKSNKSEFIPFPSTHRPCGRTRFHCLLAPRVFPPAVLTAASVPFAVGNALPR